MTTSPEKSGIDINQILIGWLQDNFGEGFKSEGDAIEYYGYIVLVHDRQRYPTIKDGCPYAVCLSDIPMADPKFFEKLKRDVEKRIIYLNKYYTRYRRNKS